MIPERYIQVDPSVAHYFTTLESISAMGISLRAMINEDEDRAMQRRKFVAFTLQEVGEFDPLLCSCIAGYLISLDDKKLFSDIARGAGITIHDKLLKKSDWKNILLEKVLFRVTKPVIREYLLHLAAGASKRVVDRLTGAFGNLKGFLDNLGNEQKLEFYEVLRRQGKTSPEHKIYAQAVNKIAVYESCVILDRKEDASLLMDSFTPLDWAVYETEILNGYYFVYGGRIGGKAEGMTSHLTALQKAKEFEERYEFERLQTEELQQQLERVNQSAEEQLEEALRRIKELEEHNELLQRLLSEQERVTDEYKALLAVQPKPLAGKHVLVVGHRDQKQMYEEEIAKRGGFGEFFPATDDETNIHLLAGPIRRADLIFYIRTYTQHRIQKYIQSKNPENLVILTCKGRDSFTREIDKYLEKI
ncbi:MULTISPECIES: hypothetical protein [unclassified Paenibacillus]|uniref:hypothetical protein n=1 Tax=unclassified Paenibacillus TaxID=185978 RepID=UPI00278BA5A4|nr:MULTISPECIES: hypothetical protein [unclassified Paenibacillus]MDQ0896263.1 hypothetical protein [Paenibacillus sp. V4I7]MDQ0913809.1 hypothetical protein [Paenibacillus sp. V4I5]